MRRWAIALRMYGALLKGNSISSPMHISRIEPMMLSVTSTVSIVISDFVCVAATGVEPANR